MKRLFVYAELMLILKAAERKIIKVFLRLKGGYL